MSNVMLPGHLAATDSLNMASSSNSSWFGKQCLAETRVPDKCLFLYLTLGQIKIK